MWSDASRSAAVTLSETHTYNHHASLHGNVHCNIILLQCEDGQSYQHVQLCKRALQYTTVKKPKTTIHSPHLQSNQPGINQ
ncbi:hypothetical protein AOLI_G00283500, partial [Acnodon oligacanthus]